MPNFDGFFTLTRLHAKKIAIHVCALKNSHSVTFKKFANRKLRDRNFAVPRVMNDSTRRRR